MKTCFKCGRALPLEAFYRHPQMADGHLGKCKDCARTDVMLNRLVRREHYLEYERSRATRPDRVEARRARSASSAGRLDRMVRNIAQKLNAPEKYRARYTTTNAVRDGHLIRGACEACGATGAEAHHDDYGEPLSVRWLCRVHHMEHHGR